MRVTQWECDNCPASAPRNGEKIPDGWVQVDVLATSDRHEVDLCPKCAREMAMKMPALNWRNE